MLSKGSRLATAYCSLLARISHTLPIIFQLHVSFPISAPIFGSFQMEDSHFEGRSAGYAESGQSCPSLFVHESLPQISQPFSLSESN
jgi:hypothetical protein